MNHIPSTNQPEILTLSKDMTLRWPCRGGDFLLWLGFRDIFAGPDSITIYDFWEMRDGQHVTITNRFEDLPPWFELHPTETCNALAYKMMAKLAGGYKPGELTDGPNLWRLRAGHRVAWVGAPRPGYPSVNGIVAILDCAESALLAGEGHWDGLEDFAGFGAPAASGVKPEDAARCRAAVTAVKQMGLPRSLASDWQLG